MDEMRVMVKLPVVIGLFWIEKRKGWGIKLAGRKMMYGQKR